MLPWDADFSGYKLVVAPSLPILFDQTIAALEASGAKVVFGPRTGSRTLDGHIPADLPPGPLVARLSSPRVFNRTMRQLWHDPATLSEADLRTMWELLTREDGKVVLPRITQYLRDRVLFWHRWVGALQQSQLPLNFLWGAEDPITGRDIAELHHAEAPGSRLTVLDGVGHYPMLEAPRRWTDALLALLA